MKIKKQSITNMTNEIVSENSFTVENKKTSIFLQNSDQHLGKYHTKKTS